MKIEDYSKYYIQGSDHYLIPKDVFIELFNEMQNWKKQSQIQQDTIKMKKLVIDNLSERITKAIHRIQLLQMDGEVTIKDLGLIARDLQGSDE